MRVDEHRKSGEAGPGRAEPRGPDRVGEQDRIAPGPAKKSDRDRTALGPPSAPAPREHGEGPGRRRIGSGIGEVGAAGPDIRCRDFFNTRSPEAPTLSPGPVLRPGSFFDAPGALRGPPEAENGEKFPSRFFHDAGDLGLCHPPRVGGGPGPNFFSSFLFELRKKVTTEVFRRFRPPGALNGPRDRQKITQEEKPVPGKASSPLGADALKRPAASEVRPYGRCRRP